MKPFMRGGDRPMSELKATIAKNLVDLRKNANWTQAELAEKLNYSDKAVSKWERAESVPDIGVLKSIAELFGVSVDYLLEEEHAQPLETTENPKNNKEQKNVNRMVVALLAVALVWLVATLVFVILKLYPVQFNLLWSVYVYAIPVSCIVLLVFNSIWGRAKLNYIIVSLLVWSLICSIYVGLLSHDLKLIFVIGIPAQIIIILWSRLKKK